MSLKQLVARWVANPRPGLSPETKNFFKALASALSENGLFDRAKEVEQDAGRLQELAIRYGVSLRIRDQT